MTEILFPLGKHLFSADALNKIAADALTKIPPDKTSAIVGGVDASGANVALVLTKHGPHADVKFVTALEHDWAGGNALGVSGVIAFCLALLLALPVSAQPLHGHPQLAAYPDPSQYPSISVQAHWAPGESPIAAEDGTPIMLDVAQGTLGTSTLSHTHLDLVKCPIYAELTGPIVCGFAVKLFHTTGEAFLDPNRQEGIRDLVWDATGSAIAPILRCAEMLCTWTGHLTLDPTLPTRWHTPHGWWSPLFSVFTQFDNGDAMSIRMIVPFYAMLDPTQPETPGIPLLSGRVVPASLRHPLDKWGDNFVETSHYLPIGPIDQPYRMLMSTAGYGGQLSGARFEQRADLDLHNHNGGRLLQEVSKDGDINTEVVFDPTVLGAGTHKMALLRNQLSNEGDDAVNTLLVFDVTVGPAFPPPIVTPPPPIVTPPPVVTPPPPVPTTFVLPLTVTVCDSSVPAKCVVTKP